MYNEKKERDDLRRWSGVTFYGRGLAYYESGRVSDYSERRWEDGWYFECYVEGHYRYRVSGRYTPGRVQMRCDCPAYEEQSRCKHCVAAALLHISKHKEERQNSDPAVRSILMSYSNLPDEEEAVTAEAEEPAEEIYRLEPRVSLTRHTQWGKYPVELSLRIGGKKLYVVKNIPDMLERFEKRREYAYGKGLVLEHREELLDEESRQLLAFVREHVQNYLSVCSSYNSSYSIGDAPRDHLLLFPGEEEKLFEMYTGKMIPIRSGLPDYEETLIREGDPPVVMEIKRENRLISIGMSCRMDRVYRWKNRLVINEQGSLWLTSQAFSKAMWSILTEGKGTMRMSQEDLPAFSTIVLPVIAPYVQIKDREGLLSGYKPDPCTSCFYFDLDRNEYLNARLFFRYGDREIRYDGDFSGIRRDVREEKKAEALLRRNSFYDSHSGFYEKMTSEEDIPEFLLDELPAFRKLGEVYLTKKLQGIEMAPSAANVKLSVADGLLTMDFDTGGFPAEELEALYQSLLLRKRYYRMKDGRFMRLGGTGAEAVAETAHMLQLKPADLADGRVTMPAFRALYLEGALTGGTNVHVQRDRQLRDMVRRFKTYSDSDDQVPEKLQGTLRSYQETGFRWLKTLESCGFGGILADEMGLGKTLQLITWLSDAGEKAKGKPSLIVCPASLVLNWQDEFRRFAPEMPVRLILGTAKEREKIINEAGQEAVWITSYDLLKRDIDLYTDKSFYCCALDEGQYIKNQSTKASKAVKAINCVQRFVLTGTPIENRLSELWNIFDFLMPGYLFSHERFVERLEKPIIQSGDPAAQERLAKLVQPFLLRRLKKDVLKELPPKINEVRRVALTEEERKVYHACVLQTMSELRQEGEKLQILAALTRLRQICCDPSLCFENYTGASSKLEACVELISSMAENGHQILLFSQFTSMLDRIRPLLDKAGITSFTLQGSTPREKRAELVRDFNAGGAQVFLISLKAGGTGLNLTAADIVIHYDPWWNQAAQDQATDRAHRIGQTQCVQVYRLIAENTIEERILELQEKKAALLENVTGGDSGESLMSMSREDLLALIGDSAAEARQ